MTEGNYAERTYAAVLARAARTEAAEAELASVREERDADERECHERIQGWLVRHNHQYRARETAEARVAQLEAALDWALGQTYFEKVQRHSGFTDAWFDQHAAARALLASQPLPTTETELSE